MTPASLTTVSTKRARFRARFLPITAAIALAASTSAHAATYEVVYTFQGPQSITSDGSYPLAGLVSDAQGRLYGTTSQGGPNGGGIVFRLTRPSSGQGPWTEEVLHGFDGLDGYQPQASLVLGSDGSVYGTTTYGGPDFLMGNSLGRGLIFKLSNVAGWPITILHAFKKDEGSFPTSGLTFGADGLLYGTTPYFGASQGGHETYNAGTAYSISPSGDQVEYARLHQFGINGTQYAPTALGAVPPLYFNGFVGGTTASATNATGIFAMQPGPPGDAAAVKQLYTFGPLPDVSFPLEPPLAGSGALSGAFFGCAGYGGAIHNEGGIYEIIPSRTAGTAETVLYNFGAQANDPDPQYYNLVAPACSLIQGTASGVLFGTTAGGGGPEQPQNDGGAFFELIPPTPPSTAWTEKVLVSFNSATGGIVPQGTLLKIGKTYYGTTSAPAVPNAGFGNVYAVTP